MEDADMQSLPRVRWLLVLATVAVIGVAFSLARAWLLADVRDRLTQKYQQRIASLSERQAALLVRHLAKSDGDWLDVLVAASADDRPIVAAAAETELRELVNRWAQRPEESSTDVADLARLLAQQAQELPPQRRHLAHSLAQRLLDWPVDGQLVDAAQLIADCQAVLLLPRVEPAEIRLAAAPPPPANAQRGRESMAETNSLTPQPPPGQRLPTPSEPPPGDVVPTPPATPSPEAQRMPQQPQPFKAISPIRISDE
jgi:hypothetical protein